MADDYEPVDLNSADIDELARLPQIGPKRAARLAEWRHKHGPFETFSEAIEIANLGDREASKWVGKAELGGLVLTATTVEEERAAEERERQRQEAEQRAEEERLRRDRRRAEVKAARSRYLPVLLKGLPATFGAAVLAGVLATLFGPGQWRDLLAFTVPVAIAVAGFVGAVAMVRAQEQITGASALLVGVGLFGALGLIGMISEFGEIDRLELAVAQGECEAVTDEIYEPSFTIPSAVSRRERLGPALRLCAARELASDGEVDEAQRLLQGIPAEELPPEGRDFRTALFLFADDATQLWASSETPVVDDPTGASRDVDLVEPGASVYVMTSAPGEWVPVLSGRHFPADTIGFVLRTALQTLPPKPPELDTYWATTAANIRSGPGTGFAIVDGLESGESFTATDLSESWAAIVQRRGEFQLDTLGFVATGLASESPPVERAPEPATRTSPAPPSDGGVRLDLNSTRRRAATSATAEDMFRGQERVFYTAHMSRLRRKCSNSEREIGRIAVNASAALGRKGHSRTPGEVLRLLDSGIPGGVQLDCAEAAATIVAMTGGG